MSDKVTIKLQGKQSELLKEDFNLYLSQLYAKNNIIFTGETFNYLLKKVHQYDGDIYGNIPQYAYAFMHKLLKAGLLWKYGEISLQEPPIKDHSSVGNFINIQFNEVLNNANIRVLNCHIKYAFVNFIDDTIYMPPMTSFQKEEDYFYVLAKRFSKYLSFMSGDAYDFVAAEKAYFNENGKLSDIKDILSKMGIF